MVTTRLRRALGLSVDHGPSRPIRDDGVKTWVAAPALALYRTCCALL